MAELEIGTKTLELSDVGQVAKGFRPVKITDEVIKNMEKGYNYLQEELKSGKAIYGVNTGFGHLSNVKISDKDLEELQYNIIRSHACGVGPLMPDTVVRAMLLMRAQSLALGFSGVGPKLVQTLISFLNKNVCPAIPQQGSVGASGDLAPLAHLALVLVGEGFARVDGEEMTGQEALKKTGIEPLRLGPKDGLALVNGTQFMSAIGILNLLNAEHLCDLADVAGAMTLEALRGTVTAFDIDLHELRPHPGQIHVADRMRSILGKGVLSEIADSHRDCDTVQDPYSLRCIPQVHGATRDMIQFVRQILERELNSVTDNPIVFPEKKKVVSGGNFHGQIVALAMDALAICVHELASISEQRIQKLVNPVMSNLPAFLTNQSGVHSGFMIVQVAAASIVSENKTLCHPASVDSIPTSADKEDHVSMGAWAARKAGRVITNTRRVLAMELLSASQGIDLLMPLKSTPDIEAVHAVIRKSVPRVDGDRPFHKDIEKIDQMIRENKFLDLV